ncbi:MAG: nuclear transport factor 2 family protein [Chitinophagales bacterium]|nr:nuclear transport factor 2 family protein [Chitinophagales bacterium]
MLTERERIVELCNKLFIYTDYREWDRLVNEVFTPDVFLDMSSLGDAPQMLNAAAVCEKWRKGFEDLDAVHHQAGNYLVNIVDHGADVFCYAIASHYKAAAKHGSTRVYTGSYHMHAVYSPMGWRLDRLQFNLKYISGNPELK